MTAKDKHADPHADFASLLDAYTPTERSDLQVGDKVQG